LFIGLSVVPYVYYKEPPDEKVPNAGKMLRALSPLPQSPLAPKP
jgi:hypothetical protein